MLDEVLAFRRSSHLLRELAGRNAAPKNIQLTAVGGGYYASVFNDVEDDAPISERVTIGFSKTPALAILKGIVEWLEREAFREGAANGFPCCQTTRSDGIAAFPLFLLSSSAAKERARTNAYAEAVERYVWSAWWDRTEIGYERRSPEAALPRAGLCSSLLAAARELVDINAFEVIIPQIEAHSQKAAVAIIVAHLNNGGAVTGGAAGRLDGAIIWERAAAELFRHCLALKRMLTSSGRAVTFYQKRILFFGSGAGNELVRRRLETVGIDGVRLPKLSFDEEIQYAQSDLVYVHRCLFEGQPHFMAGFLERLCI